METEKLNSFLSEIQYCLLENSNDSFIALEEEFKRIEKKYSKSFSNEQRKREFYLGRIAARFAMKDLLNDPDIFVGQDESRAPIWPNDIVGSISHNTNYIIAVATTKSKYKSIGIDIEQKNRTKDGMKKFICSEFDIKSHPNLSDSELLTLIFSAKESLYKALYPLVQKYFGFHAAAVTELISENKFEIRLLDELSSEFGPKTISKFVGSYIFLNNCIITMIKINQTK